MTKAILEFDLNDPDDLHEYEIYTKVFSYHIALNNIDNLCRSELKYGQIPIPDHIEALLDKIRIECRVLD